MIIRPPTCLSLICVIVTSFMSYAYSQSALPIKAYGVWDRSNGQEYDPNNPNYNYLLGVSSEATWSDIQPDDSSHFNWQGLQGTLDRATSRNQYLYIGIDFGPNAPPWIYDNGVPKVYTNDSEHEWPYYPYYLNSNYKRFYFRFIRELGNFLHSQTENRLGHIAFIQVKTGCTGDEVPYKGAPLDPQYNLSKSSKAWRDFRIAVFDSFRVACGTGSNAIPLMFNFVDPVSTPDEWNWVMTNIGKGFGLKEEGALVRGHHLSHEKEGVDQWNPFLVNPQGLALFSRSEMDQTWTRPLYQINTELGFYWGAINGLNEGLSVWDISQTALTEAGANASIQQTFRFFNKYANQIYPSSSTRAFIVLHEGLNSADTKKFPENKYGNANMNNAERYKAICSDSVYASRGATMDDVAAAREGQVYQRKYQTGYNDAGWEIWPTNYSRFITQVNPDSESIGLFRVGGTINNRSHIYSRFARSFEYRTGRNAMYFKLHDDFFKTSADTVTITVYYYDNLPYSTWELRYDAGKGKFKTAISVSCTGSKTWKNRTIVVTDAVMLHNGPSGSDCALVNTDSVDDIFHMIEIEKGAHPLTTTVREERAGTVSSYSLNQNYPNPFNPSTVIEYSLPEAGAVTLKIYNLLGQEVTTLVDEYKQKGNYRLTFDSNRLALSSGMYIYKYTCGKYSQAKKMILLK